MYTTLNNNQEPSSTKILNETVKDVEKEKEEVQEGAIKVQHTINSNSNHENSSTETSNETVIDVTSIQESDTVPTRETEESKQVEPKISIQVELDKPDGISTNKGKGLAIKEYFKAKINKELSEKGC